METLPFSSGDPDGPDFFMGVFHESGRRWSDGNPGSGKNDGGGPDSGTGPLRAAKILSCSRSGRSRGKLSSSSRCWRDRFASTISEQRRCQTRHDSLSGVSGGSVDQFPFRPVCDRFRSQTQSPFRRTSLSDATRQQFNDSPSGPSDRCGLRCGCPLLAGEGSDHIRPSGSARFFQ